MQSKLHLAHRYCMKRLQDLRGAFFAFYIFTGPCNNNAGPICCHSEVELTLGQKITDEHWIHPSPNAASCPWGVVLNLFSVKWESADGRMGLGLIMVLSHPIPALNLDTVLLCTGTGTTHTCQSSLDLAPLPVYKRQEWHAGIQYRDVHQPGLTLMCSWCELMFPGVVMPLMRRTCGAGAGHTSLLMTF